MNNPRQIPTLAKMCYRHASQAAEVASPRFSKLRSIQEKFQVEDGTPVFLKSGAFDKLLYGTTSLLTVVGLGLSIETFCTIAFKKN